MDYNVLLETGTGNSSEKLSFNRMKIEGDNKQKGLASLKKGQLITGTVVSVDEQIILNFNGQKVTTQKSVLNNAIPGERKTFEVMKVSENEIELRPMNESSGNNKRSFKAAMVKEGDWEMLQSQKEQAARKTEQETEYKDILVKLEEISTKLTELDYRLLEEEGFGLENFSVNGLYEALNRIKACTSGDEQKKVGKMQAFEEEALMNKLKEENLPATSENIAKLTKALELSNTIAKMDDKAMKYLISRDAMPTIENIYKAYYSQTVRVQENQQTLTGKEWSELESQVKDVIKSAGHEVNQENLDSAKWLIENKLLLTPETFTYKKNLEDIKVDADKDQILNKVLEGMKNGVNPKDVSLRPQNEISSSQLITNIHSIRKETITKAVKDGTEL
ncbi:MAG: hypothetical protein K0S76_3137, partial [Herbinix sp.]|nr:hypothetical protein [Herbinix sp.]